MELPELAFLFRVTYSTRMRNDPKDREPLMFHAEFLAESVDDFKESFDRFKRKKEARGLEFTYVFFSGQLPLKMLEGRVFQLYGNENFGSPEELEEHLKLQEEYNNCEERHKWKEKLLDIGEENYGKWKRQYF